MYNKSIKYLIELFMSNKKKSTSTATKKDNNTPTRKMAAILAADVVGYSKLMAVNEAQTLKSLKETRTIIDKTIIDHNGRIFNTAGDSVMAEFASPVEAVEAASKFQKLLKEWNNINDNNIVFRVGINLGDIMMQDNNLFGDNVNIAARLESIATPGEISISDKVYQEIYNKVETHFVLKGEKSLKNIAHKVKVYASAQNKVKKGKFNLLSKSLKLTILVLFIGFFSVSYIIYENLIRKKEPSYNQQGVSSQSVLETFKSSQDEDLLNSEVSETKKTIALMEFNFQGNGNSEISTIAYDYIKNNLTNNSSYEITKVEQGSENLNPPEVMLIATEVNAAFIINGTIYSDDTKLLLSLKLYESRRGTNMINHTIEIDQNNLSSIDKELRKFINAVK